MINVHADGPFTIIRNLLQNNLVGAPVIHKVSTWDFDPDVSLKRREQFQEVCILHMLQPVRLFPFPSDLSFHSSYFSIAVARFSWWKTNWEDRSWNRRQRCWTLTRSTGTRWRCSGRHYSSYQTRHKRCGVTNVIIDIQKLSYIIYFYGRWMLCFQIKVIDDDVSVFGFGHAYTRAEMQMNK